MAFEPRPLHRLLHHVPRLPEKAPSLYMLLLCMTGSDETDKCSKKSAPTPAMAFTPTPI
jgi:hypothetical protein